MTTTTLAATRPTMQFAMALIRGSLNDLRTLGITLFTPLFMLVLFWVVGRPAEPGDTDLVSFIFPAIVGLTVMLGGQAVATRIVNWREQGVFQRLAATPTPLGHLVVGLGLAQAVVSSVQAVAVLLFGVLVLGLRVHGGGAAAALAVLALGVMSFIAFGCLVASLAAKPDVASAAFTFTLLPMFFLGGGFPPEILPPVLRAVSPWLPTAMLNSLLSPLLAGGTLPAAPWWPLLGLLAYTVGFGALAAWRFRWE
jgi:ABC-type multidrug transport system permease subunit